VTPAHDAAMAEALAAAKTAQAIDTLGNGRVLFGFKGMPLSFVVADAMATPEAIAELLLEQSVIAVAQAHRAAQMMTMAAPAHGGMQ
jgi:hypothetical protein